VSELQTLEGEVRRLCAILLVEELRRLGPTRARDAITRVACLADVRESVVQEAFRSAVFARRIHWTEDGRVTTV
jgi:hypothetical protein